MSGSRGEALGPAATGEEPWPYCANIKGTCLAYDTGLHLGASIASTLFSFILNAEEGARLTLQRNHEGFTAQVTGAVLRAEGLRAEGETFGLEEAQALRMRLDLGKSRRQ